MRNARLQYFAILCCIVATGGCASSRQRTQQSPANLAGSSTEEKQSAPSVADTKAASAPSSDSSNDREMRQVNHNDAEPEALPPPQPPMDLSSISAEYPIDLVTALRLADADNLTIAMAREQIQQAYAEYGTAGALWLPSIRAGTSWNRHIGPLQATDGSIQQVNRDSLWAGMGAFPIGSGTVPIPGLFANFNIADAIFQPLAVQQRWGAREQAASAVRNNTLLDVSVAYLELLRSTQDMAIVQDVRDKVAELARLTEAYVKSGQGLQADADRMRVELGLRDIELRRSKEAYISASARLTQLLRLEPCVRLEPIEPHVVQLCLIPKECQCADLVAQALTNRPELRQNRYLVGEVLQLLRREKYAPLVPSVILGASYGGFGGGQGANINGFSDRVDLDAVAFWELRNLGFGQAAARNTAASRLRQAQIQELASLDLVAREVTEAHAQVQIREQQIETARNLLTFAADSYDHNLVRIRQGQGLPIEVLQSTQALLQARREYLRSMTDYNSAQFTLQRALGWPVGGPELAQGGHHDGQG
jgi:outer membrane protein TolC